MTTSDKVTPSERAALIAYLDGELAPAERLRWEKRVAREPQLALELRALQGAWDALDVLEHPTSDARFTTTTLQRVAADIDPAASRITGQGRWKRIARYALLVACAACVTFLLLRTQMARRHQQYLRDLEVAAQWEMYQQAEGLVFLRQLEQSGLFDEELGHVP